MRQRQSITFSFRRIEKTSQPPSKSAPALISGYTTSRAGSERGLPSTQRAMTALFGRPMAAASYSAQTESKQHEATSIERQWIHNSRRMAAGSHTARTNRSEMKSTSLRFPHRHRGRLASDKFPWVESFPSADSAGGRMARRSSMWVWTSD